MFAHLGQENIRGMLIALSAALLVAALLLGLVLKSWKITLVALVCNMLPVLLVYSVWAVANGQISIGASIVMGMILGIVVDDTIYLLTSYRRHRLAGENSPVLQSLRDVGPAIVITTSTLAVGLSVGLVSDFGPIRDMSALSVAIISVALLIDALLLPALLLESPANPPAGASANV